MRILFFLLLSSIFLFSFSFFGGAKEAKKTVTLKAMPTLNPSVQAEKAFAYLNHLRTKAGMSNFFHNTKLEQSALAHANYLTLHNKIGHYEDLGEAGFTGVLPKDRIAKAGYRAGISIENVSNNALGFKHSVDGLFAAIYHRFGFLDFQADEIGIGVSQKSTDNSITAYVYNMGVYEINDLCKGESYRGRESYNYNICVDKSFRIKESAFNEGYNACYKRNKKIVIYPYDEQDDIPPAFYDEMPDPLPAYRVSGFPISIQFNPYYFKYVKLKRFELFLEGKKVALAQMYDHISDINSYFKRNEFAIFPQERLRWGSRYHVAVAYEVAGKSYTKEWDFTTKTLPSKAIMIDKNKVEVKISASKGTILYFKPKDQNDILDNILFDTKLDVDFIDKNTIMIRTTAEVGETFELEVSGRKISLLVGA